MVLPQNTTLNSVKNNAFRQKINKAFEEKKASNSKWTNSNYKAFVYSKMKELKQKFNWKVHDRFEKEFLKHHHHISNRPFLKLDNIHSVNGLKEHLRLQNKKSNHDYIISAVKKLINKKAIKTNKNIITALKNTVIYSNAIKNKYEHTLEHPTYKSLLNYLSNHQNKFSHFHKNLSKRFNKPIINKNVNFSRAIYSNTKNAIKNGNNGYLYNEKIFKNKPDVLARRVRVHVKNPFQYSKSPKNMNTERLIQNYVSRFRPNVTKSNSMKLKTNLELESNNVKMNNRIKNLLSKINKRLQEDNEKWSGMLGNTHVRNSKMDLLKRLPKPMGNGRMRLSPIRKINVPNAPRSPGTPPR
jgi:hypothetical protein